ncbi:MAG: ATP-binding cassette domain-containing protein [Dethiobacteria bacterium]|jgi:ABC-type sugar transport system ATPase subunit|nr:sugar ABC transporter ATP-binding protein [Bacillota bacterium]
MIRANNISMNFGMIKALKNVSFELEAGKILGLVGDNGAGKSTLLKILCGYLQPTSGEIYIEDKRVQFKSSADAMKEGVAITHQFLELVDMATAWENFFMGREITGKGVGPFKLLDINQMKELTRKAIEKYGLSIDLECEVGKLSGEERQIIAVARAIESDPKILLLDESFTLLSLEGREELVNFLKKVNQQHNVTMIIVSHDLELVKNLTHKIMVLRGGEKIFYGDTEEVSVDQIVEFMLPQE